MNKKRKVLNSTHNKRRNSFLFLNFTGRKEVNVQKTNAIYYILSSIS